MSQGFVTNQEIIMEARRNLSQDAWDYLTGGAESETTMRRNRLGLDCLALRPRVLVNVSKVDTATTFLGHQLRIPVMLAPIGRLQSLHPEGGMATAKAAGDFGTIPFISSVAQPPFEEIAANNGDPKILQLYVRGDLDWCKSMVGRAKAAGYVALCLTVDNAHYGRMERQMLSRYLDKRVRSENRSAGALLTWDMLDAIKESADMPLVVKGIATAEDASLAIDHGVDVIYVSNHGGRALDHGRATIDILPEVVDAARGKADVILDGGVTRATDVVKAIALGAKAVAIGRLYGFGLAAAGAEGVVRVLEILEEELIVAMGLLGTTTVQRIGRSHVCEARPVDLPHLTSAFTHLPRL